MLPSGLVALLLLINCAWSYTDNNDNNNNGFQSSEGGDLAYLYPEELADDGEWEVTKRTGNNNFLRFGRAGGGGAGAGAPAYDEYDDYSDDFARPTRSGKVEKNDHFIRFGRGKQNYIRFGRDPQRVPRANHLRFGRAVDKMRAKREVASDDHKRADSNFLRFGRPNGNFVRFGRQPGESPQDYETAHRQLAQLWQKLRRIDDARLAGVVMMELLNGARGRVAV